MKAKRTPAESSIAIRVAKHRAELRKKGLRPVQIWVPDTRSKAFRAKWLRATRKLANDPQEAELLEFIEKAQDFSGWR
jgi:hypothetical protein